VQIEHLTAELKLTQPSEIAAYTSFFDRLAEAARYGPEARALITRALADLMATSQPAFGLVIPACRFWVMSAQVHDLAQ
jgi:hypothetical protein